MVRVRVRVRVTTLNNTPPDLSTPFLKVLSAPKVNVGLGAGSCVD